MAGKVPMSQNLKQAGLNMKNYETAPVRDKRKVKFDSELYQKKEELKRELQIQMQQKSDQSAERYEQARRKVMSSNSQISNKKMETVDQVYNKNRDEKDELLESVIEEQDLAKKIEPFKDEVSALISLLGKASMVAQVNEEAGLVAQEDCQEGNSLAEREVLRTAKIEKIYEMQEELDSVMQSIKKNFKAQIRK